jgi:hypothetical protein
LEFANSIRPVFCSRQRSFQRSGIAHSMQSPKLLDGPRMKSEHFVCTEEKHSDRLYSGPCASWVYARCRRANTVWVIAANC